MSSYRRLAASVALIASLAACSGAPPLESTTPSGQPPQNIDGSPSGARSRATGDEAEDRQLDVDVSPVSAPGEIVFHLRWKNPGASLASAARYTSLPAGFVSANIRQGVVEIVREALGSKVNVDAFADLISIDAPIDLVVTADMSRGGQVPEPMMALSVGLTSLQRALDASKGKPRKISDGVWQIGTQDKWGKPCAVTAAAGKAPARLVCGERTRHVERLAAFMARNVAVLPDPPHDLRAEVKLRGVLQKYGRAWANQARGLPVIAEEFKLGVPSFDQALMDAADALATEAGDLIHDADSFAVDIGIDGVKGITFAMALKFAGKQSWFVQSLLDGAHLTGPAPDIFWQVPKSSDMVTYGHSSDPTRYGKILRIARALLEGALQKEKIGSAADRKAIAKLLRFPVTKKHVASVAASGHFPGAAASARQPKRSLTDIVKTSIGWHIVGYEARPAQMRTYLNEVVKVYNRPTLQKLMKKELGSDAKNLPKIKTVTAPASLGAGSLAIEITVPNLEDPLGSITSPPGAMPTKPKVVTIKVYILLMSNSGRTWLGVATDRNALAKVMAQVKGSTPGPNALAKRPDLGRFRNERHSSGSLTSLDGAIGSIEPMMNTFMGMAPGNVSGPGQQILNLLSQMPNKGKTPITTFVDVKDGARPSVSIVFNMPRATLEDIGFLVTSIMKIVQQASPSP